MEVRQVTTLRKKAANQSEKTTSEMGRIARIADFTRLPLLVQTLSRLSNWLPTLK